MAALVINEATLFPTKSLYFLFLNLEAPPDNIIREHLGIFCDLRSVYLPGRGSYVRSLRWGMWPCGQARAAGREGSSLHTRDFMGPPPDAPGARTSPHNSAPWLFWLESLDQKLWAH